MPKTKPEVFNPQIIEYKIVNYILILIFFIKFIVKAPIKEYIEYV